jgi:hypothetical protein
VVVVLDEAVVTVQHQVVVAVLVVEVVVIHPVRQLGVQELQNKVLLVVRVMVMLVHLQKEEVAVVVVVQVVVIRQVMVV